MRIRLSAPLLFAALLLAVSVGCASGLPAVVSSNASSVSVEFDKEGSVTEAGELAKEECGKYGKVPDFEAVDSVAAPNSRIANFRCLDPNSTAVGAGETDK